jgi:hypothetical protein
VPSAFESDWGMSSKVVASRWQKQADEDNKMDMIKIILNISEKPCYLNIKQRACR